MPALTCTVTVLLTVKPESVTIRFDPEMDAEAVAFVATIMDWLAIVQADCEVNGNIRVVKVAESTYVPLAEAWLTTGEESTTLKVQVAVPVFVVPSLTIAPAATLIV